MTYRNHTERCPHGFAKFIRCEQCEGRQASLTNVEASRPGQRRRLVVKFRREWAKRQLRLAAERDGATG